MKRITIIAILVLLTTIVAQGQIKIGGSVYGGGNAGDLTGNTSVTVYAGDLNNVYGGARMADVGGNAFVNVDGEHASDYIIINKVYGGNDIAGTIGQTENASLKVLPAASLKLAGENGIDNTWDACLRISTKTTTDSEGKVVEAADAKKIYIGQLFGGGNGAYDYTTGLYSGMNVPELAKTYLEICGGSIVYAYGGGNEATVTDKTVICVDNPSKVVNHILVSTAKGTKGKEADAETYTAYEHSDPLVVPDGYEELLTNDRFKNQMGINLGFSYPSSDAFQIGRLFGGNNVAEMAIIPKWNLKSGSIRNLYSGGNEGPMTSSTGILLEIAEDSKIRVDNVYGGCRKADVRPMAYNLDSHAYEDVDHVSNPQGYNFPADLAARLLVRGGDINNVYGGNDISGKVYFGNAVGVYTSIRGDVYGGGNGSYPYTDCEYLENDETYGDLYYNPAEVIPGKPDATSVEALNAFRPNAEQVSLRLVGKADKPTIIGGSVYVGGNSATLKKKAGAKKHLAELKIGSYVIADRVFLGNNGKNMVVSDNETDALRMFARKVTSEGVLVAENGTAGEGDKPFNSMKLVGDGNVFDQYMDGCAMDLLPSVVFDSRTKGDPENYDPYSSYFGSFYCGGNVGSMISSGTTTIDFTHKIVIYDKLVGGCNSAFVPATAYNAAYEGGVIGSVDERASFEDDGGNIKNRIILNLSNLKIEPKRWAVERDANYEPVLTNGEVTYLLSEAVNGDPTTRHRYLEWNTVDSRVYYTATKTYKEMEPVTSGSGGESDEDDLARRLFGGNIYGGCCESGIVNGNVVINLDASLEVRDILFDVVQSNELGEEESLYGSEQTSATKYNITQRHTGVILGQQGMDVFGSALNVFGGGKGKSTEIWGSTVINLNRGYTFQIFGGSEEGVIGRPVDVSKANDYVYNYSSGQYSFNGKLFEKNAQYSCYVNLCGTKAGVSKAADTSEDMAECEFMYGGGFFGPIAGNTVINMGNGRIFNSFGGSCNGDILGVAETFMGRQVKEAYKIEMPSNVVEQDVFEPGFTWVRDMVYGANDLGGRILGENDYKSRVRGVRQTDTQYSFNVIGKVHNPGNKDVPDVLKASAYVEYLQGRADAIFGGCYGTYDYKDRKFARYTYTTGETVPEGKAPGDPKTIGNSDPIFFKPRLNNAFVNFRPTYYNDNNVVKSVYGAGQGESGEKERDLLQNRSYVLIDIPQISNDQSENFNKYSHMEVFGAGAWGGVGMNYTYEQTSTDGFNLDKASAIIDLMRGEIGAAYGGSLSEGVTRRTVVNVPSGSTIKIGSIFGGAYGKDTYLPCDVYEAHVEYHSADAVLVNDRPRVENNVALGNPIMLGAIYGGNNNQRRTIYGIINIDVPVWQEHYHYGMTKANVYGAGYGSRTWNEYTEVNLKRGAEVFEVYGGGEAGGVMSAESVEKYVKELKPNIAENTPMPDEDWRVAWTLGSGYDPSWDSFDYAANESTNLQNLLAREAEIDDRKDTEGTPRFKRYNTNVIINEGAYVGNYAYGGGYGKEDDKFAGSGDVYGTTYIALLGGTVNKDIYAAGTSGAVYDLFGVGAYDATNNPKGFTASANAYIKGGTVRNVYGGGWRGSVGYHKGAIGVVANNVSDQLGEAHVVIGDADGTSHVSGIPSVTRNVYGGGEGGAIFGDAYVTMYKGYVGYRYKNTAAEDATPKYEYVPELDDVTAGDNKLELGGNIFGGGYVANSYVDSTHVTMWDGVVRGSLYGGGEIGPVGRGTVHTDSLAKYSQYKKHNYGFEGCQPAAIYKGGETHVYLWGGHVMRDVFGGGRGYDNWNGEGFFKDEDEKNNMDRSSKGYVFGSTDVHIRGGEIGTKEGMLKGYGNVFGGGNEGFVYSGTGEKKGTDRSDEHLTKGKPTDGGGFYYIDGNINKNLSLDCNITVEPYCKVKDGHSINIGSKTYSAGEYVPVEDLNKLKNRNNDKDQWEHLNIDGVTIHNAIFAGGNITEGSDNLFANTTTVYGNAAASLRDVYNFDLISLGTDDMGGLYGDGNLTLVNGFRELHIDNYGTDYYSLDDNLLIDEYNKLTERQKAYYKLKYVTNSSHTFDYYECKELHTYEVKEDDIVVSSTAYKRGQKISEADFLAFPSDPDGERKYWTKGTKTYEKDDQIEEGEYILMYGAEQANWLLYGVTSIYAGRPMNTIQRADMCGVFGSRMVLRGAEDRVVNTIDYHAYTINRVDEVSLNKRTSVAGDTGKDEVHGNYFGIYSEVNYLGNLTSDVFFTETDNTADHSAIRKTDSDIDANKADGETTYYQWKSAKPQAKNRNNGISHNKVALASGVFLEIKREESEILGEDEWGYITGVVELDLINVMQGMGGGYVYARNEHGVKTHHPDWGKVTLLDYNNGARTYRRFTYTDKNEVDQLQQIETSGNFVHNVKQIVDDCYPNGGIYKDGYTKSPAHYWFIRGQIYVYDQYISAFTGSANAYAEKVEMPLTISAASNGRMTLREVQPNYYAYYDKNGNKLGDTSVNADDKIIVNNETYHLNDPVSYWAYRLMSDAEKARFVEETYVVIDTCKVNDVLHLKGEVLLPSEYKALKNAAQTVTYEEGDEWKSDAEHGFDYFFRPSNNLSSKTGYVLTYDVNNPMVWNNYYTKTTSPGQTDALNTTEYAEGKKGTTTINKADYTEGPTYTPKSGQTAVYAQQEYKYGDIVFARTKQNYDSNVKSHIGYTAIPNGETLTPGKTYYTSDTGTGKFIATGEEMSNGSNYYTNGQAMVTEQAYIVTKEYSVKDDVSGAEVQHLSVGTPIYPSKYTAAQWTDITTTTNSAEVAKVCTTLLDFTATDYVYAGQLMTAAQVEALKAKVIAKNDYKDDPAGTGGKTAEQKAEAFLNSVFDDAYYCTEEGLYGGSYFEGGKAYSALETWCSMTAEERQHFDFNYDALDLLVDPTYDRNEAFEYVEGNYGYKPKYDGYNHDGTKSSDRALTEKVYSATKPIDYQAEFAGYKDQSGSDVTTVSYKDENNQTVTILKNSDEKYWLTREQYEDIPNEKHHYSPITVTAPGNYYVVKNVFMRGDIPYTTGQVIDETSYLSMTPNQRENIDVFNFTESMTNEPKKNDQGEYIKDKYGNNVYDPIYYFYSRDSYKVNEKGMGVAVTTTVIQKNGEDVSQAQATTYGTNADVPQGIIIDQGAYDDLKNFQQGFIIHGLSPTETSTLYVSAESDIHDLSTEKIITVIYLYEYEESDESGLNVMPVSERHIVNIHINFKSGVPEIGDIQKPDIVLPGTTIGMNIPTVSQGAYRVTESGWELFESESDARTHTNGQTYYNNETPVYWYQNNYWIAYYAQTYLGKTYSNSVPISVANYHDLAKVMGDPQHHYYIDHKDAGYEPKIYINDYSEDATPQNGLDLFKNLMDLTHGTAVTGHSPLTLDNPGKPIRNAQYLEFFLRADQDHGPTTVPNPAHDTDPSQPETITVNHPWTPIANGDNECFSGVLHGDGHTISGLDHSLFNHLCGRVYNLGVKGSFTGAGVAETGEGYVENCWVMTTETPVTGAGHYAVFGNPSRQGESDLVQVVNSYYPESNAYTVPTGDAARHGVPTQKPDKAFYNGEVAYDLNGFYLNKRFYDNNSSWPGTKKPYSYWRANADGTLPETMTGANYPADYAFYPLTGVSGQTNLYGYVEDRFVDGDFIYAGGTIPTSPNERLYEDPDTKEKSYHAIWPDDYLFFGQALNYGHMDGKNGRDERTHQNLPAVINKAEERVLTTMAGNRVFRAPAYFRSKKMGIAHFNPYAVLVAEEKLTAEQIADNVKPREAYLGMTAIDFTGSNGDLAHGYTKGSDTSAPYADITGGAFFPPLLDDGGLQGLYADLTRNLLAYTMTTTDAARQTDHVVANYLHDEQYVETAKAPANSTYSDTYRYHTVAERDAEADAIRGHRVQKQEEDVFVALNDHVLIDKQDFNAPISYKFADGQRMWYQRKPDNYVDIEWIDHDNNESTPLVRTTKGWEGISLPFKVEIVTTNDKGELTHFYKKSNDDDANHNVGHEYWLRDYRGGSVSSPNAKVFEATFNYPDALKTDGDKDYTNTFLWDYYYSHNNYDDQNGDDYQEDDANRDYYKYAHTYYDYPRMAAAMPYIIGLPGERFYEFDLSGNFEAATAMNVHPKQLEAQTLTFASKPGETTIGVSDDETGVAADSYRFKPSYLNESFAAGSTTGVYTLNTAGNSYQVIAAAAGSGADPVPDTKVYAFRPYFVSANGLTRGIEQIVFGNGSLEMKGVEEHGDPTKEELNGGLRIWTKKDKIFVESSLKFTEDMRVVTPAGITVATFSVKPGQTVEVQADFSGLYIVHTLDGLYTKKVYVRK
ncbi:MAG: hypothetical protein IJ886_09120 [Prevotella sp.]|nr:hypothetical protein [Prevotella sp.]